jgi:hypothetical protein
MINDPDECRALLTTAVVTAHVTPEEHKQIGMLWIHHRDLYGEMLKADVSKLPKLGMKRYTATKVVVRPVQPGLPARRRGRL